MQTNHLTDPAVPANPTVRNVRNVRSAQKVRGLSLSLSLPLSLSLSLSLGLGLMSAAQAATLTVNSSSDAVNPGGVCTLRGAVAAINGAANANGCSNAAAAYGSSDTILFAPALAGSTIVFASQIAIQKNLVIDGTINNTAAITLDGNSATRLLSVSGAGNIALTISHLTLQNGNVVGGHGGAIDSNQAGHVLTVQDSTFSVNRASGSGGAIYADSVTISRSLFSGNQSSEASIARGGGAVFAQTAIDIADSRLTGNTAVRGSALLSPGRIAVETSTFGNNTGSLYGGAIYINSGGGTIDRSTFSGNTAITAGGAVYVASSLTVGNSTFLGNSASYGGALYFSNLARSSRLTARELTLVNNRASDSGPAIHLIAGPADLSNSLIVGGAGVAMAQCGVESGGTFNSGTNLEWRNGSNENSCNSTAPILVPGGFTLARIVDSVLADHGGPTQTLALPLGSPAIDAGNPAAASGADQRGFFRPIGSAPDLGAYEYGSFTIALPPPAYPVTQAFVTTADDHGTSLSSITGLIVPNPGDIGQPGAYFVFAYLPETVAVAPDSTWYLDSALNWHPFTDCRITPAYFTGTLQVLGDLPVIPVPSDLSLFKGAELHFGYGLGGYAAPGGSACNDMLFRQSFTRVYTVQ